MAQTGRKLQLVFDDALVERVDRSLGGLSRSEWMRLAAEYCLDNRVKLVKPPLVAQRPGCPHPKEKRVQLGYGTVCGECHILVS